jgi:uncharacterized protein YodC (DUF2158 family)
MEVGSVVRLKSGGPLMTINAMRNKDGILMAWCDWFDAAEVKSGAFPVTSLESVNL